MAQFSTARFGQPTRPKACRHKAMFFFFALIIFTLAHIHCFNFVFYCTVCIKHFKNGLARVLQRLLQHFKKSVALQSCRQYCNIFNINEMMKKKCWPKNIFKGLSKSHSLNHHLKSHLHKSRFLYLFTLQWFFYISWLV